MFSNSRPIMPSNLQLMYYWVSEEMIGSAAITDLLPIHMPFLWGPSIPAASLKGDARDVTERLPACTITRIIRGLGVK